MLGQTDVNSLTVFSRHSSSLYAGMTARIFKTTLPSDNDNQALSYLTAGPCSMEWTICTLKPFL